MVEKLNNNLYYVDVCWDVDKEKLIEKYGIKSVFWQLWYVLDDNMNFWKLYHTINLRDDVNLRQHEKALHYLMANSLHKDIENFREQFLSSRKKIINKHNRWNFDELLWNILISMFISYKEGFMAKKWYSWENQLNRINEEDLKKLNISSNIKINNAPDNVKNSDKKIIEEIRNALSHWRYIIYNNSIHIRNPKNLNPKIHACDFEAIVPLRFLYNYIRIIRDNARRVPILFMKSDDKTIYEYPNDFTFDEIKDKIHYYKCATDKSVQLESLRSAVITVWKMRKENDCEKYEIVKSRKEILITNKLESLIKKYLNEDDKNRIRKNHKIDYKNLLYIGQCLIAPQDRIIWDMLVFLEESWDKYTPEEFIEHAFESIYLQWWYLASILSRWESEEEIIELMNLLKSLLKNKQENWKPLLMHEMGSLHYAHSFLTNKRGFSYDRESNSYKKWKLEINGHNVRNVIGDLNSIYFSFMQTAKTLPNWFRIQFIKSVYINQLVSLKDDTVPWLRWKPNWGEFTNRERVRNALIHNNYIMLYWVDEILLRDGYDKKTDSWAWEEIIDLSQLYEETYKEMIHNMGNESNIVYKTIKL